jgi:G3E family GTPase
MARALVVINEFGEIGLDHDLVEHATDDMVMLQSGCLCCTVRSDVIETLLAMLGRARSGDIAPFERVVIETTGLADPAPILQAFMSDPQMTRHFALDGVVTTVDAVLGAATLDRHIEAVKQAAVADRLLITKTDLEGAAEETVERRLRALNPGAPVLFLHPDLPIHPGLLFDVGLYDPASKSLDVRRWLDDEKYPSSDAHAHDHGRDHDVNRHDAHIHAICLTCEAPIPGETLDGWLSGLLRLRGPDLLRFKAIVNVAELPGPVVLHGVQHVIHPPLVLKEWPSGDRRTRMVFITYDIDEASLRRSFRDTIASLPESRTQSIGLAG